MDRDIVRNGGAMAGYFVVGLGLGALLGIFFAPKSGQETREYLSHKAGEGKEYARRKADEWRGRAEDLVDRGKRAVMEQTEAVSRAAEAGREAYRAEMSNA